LKLAIPREARRFFKVKNSKKMEIFKGKDVLSSCSIFIWWKKKREKTFLSFKGGI